VEIFDKSGKKCTILTPSHTDIVKSTSKRNYRSAATKFIAGAKQKHHLINALAPHIRVEMKKIF